MDVNKKTDEIYKRERSFKNDEKRSSDNQMKHGKKERSSARHSYHQNMGGALNGVDTYEYYEFNEDQRSFISRERSFVRPQSTATLAHSQIKDQHHQKRRSGMALNPRGKPALEIYRPPTLRSSNATDPNEEIYNGKTLNNAYDSQGNVLVNTNHKSNTNYIHNYNNGTPSYLRNKNMGNYDRNQRPGLNIHAKEFISGQGASLHHSMSSSGVNMFQQGKRNLQHSRSGVELKLEGMISNSKVHFAEPSANDPDEKVGMTFRTQQPKASLEPYGSVHNPIKRSKSLGSVDLRLAVAGDDSLEPLTKIGPFSKEVQKIISEAINDPNKLSARHLMDAVRHIIIRVTETSRYSEPGAQICIKIIQKEKGETFLETLLNTCQEYYQERQRLLRNTPNAPSYPSGAVSYPRWIAYMSFLNEMYTQLKRRHNQLMTQQLKNNETPPGIHLLTLLAQCCYVCLQESVINSLSETECLFFVLTAVGKDIELKLPQYMARVMCAARDAFLNTVRIPAVRKTLLQLIEMHAARWHLSAPAVMYYYPGCCPTK